MELKIEKLMEYYYIYIYPESTKIINGALPGLISEPEEIAQRCNIPLQDYIKILIQNKAIKTPYDMYLFKDHSAAENAIDMINNFK